ncbi:hypothetical protein GC096_22775 [Paenibacillus sp. LMG 31461]|uniref:Uncharacterized protein n=1 Tax=Paenibacillus plantarum TaxID=2654975 RepID=A0ABX1XG50_9BACL|nr:hypothetical protein [Paenibacillus plantarum]
MITNYINRVRFSKEGIIILLVRSKLNIVIYVICYRRYRRVKSQCYLVITTNRRFNNSGSRIIHCSEFSSDDVRNLTLKRTTFDTNPIFITN